VIPAFLPPDRDALLAQDPDDEVTAFLAAHDPVISSNAFSLEDYRGVPLYGADLMPGLLAKICRRHPRAGVLLYLATCGTGDLARLDALRAAAREAGVEEHLCIVTGSRPFGPALVRSRVMIRPTVTDGDAVSVREALWLDVPVVATDCVERPEGTIVVRTRDAEALAAGVEAALDSLDAEVAPAPQKEDPFDQMLSVYRASIGRRM
jgi:glycosyltransferase involved in cell wall biosynthesis